MISDYTIQILLIEEDARESAHFAAALSELDPSIRLVTIHDSVDAIIKLGREPVYLPDYIFLNLPWPECKSFLEGLRRIDGKGSIPVVVYSSGDLSGRGPDLVRCGASYYFSRPGSHRHLVSLLRGILSAHISH